MHAADHPVFRTGYINIKETARKIFGDEVVGQVGDVYGLDEEGELKGSFRPSGHPGVSTGYLISDRTHR